MAGPDARFSGISSVVLAGLAQDDRTIWVQAPLALAILGAPVVCLVLFAVSLHGRGSYGLRLAAGLLPLVALGLYALYETGVSPETNIRVDLLLIYPALLLTFVSWPAMLVAALLRRRRVDSGHR